VHWIPSAARRTEVAVGLALLGGVATLRCRAFAAVYLLSVAASLGLHTALSAVIERARPAEGPMAGLTDSYPSGHITQATVMAGLLPLAILILTRRPWLARAAGVVLAVGVAGSLLARVAEGQHWASDALGGALLGTSVVLWGLWVLREPARHLRCRGCPWSTARHPEAPQDRGPSTSPASRQSS
jgi:membrane-associated phospholipid phosphatase